MLMALSITFVVFRAPITATPVPSCAGYGGGAIMTRHEHPEGPGRPHG